MATRGRGHAPLTSAMAFRRGLRHASSLNRKIPLGAGGVGRDIYADLFFEPTVTALALQATTYAGGYALDVNLTAATPESAGFTVTRALAGYAQKADKSWQKFASGVGRQTTKGLLVESAINNDNLYSVDATAVDWGMNGNGASLGAVTAPDGSSTAWEYTENGGGPYVHNVFEFLQRNDGGSAEWYTHDYFLKAGTARYVHIEVTTQGLGNNVWVECDLLLGIGTISATSGTGTEIGQNLIIEDCGGGWWRYSWQQQHVGGGSGGTYSSLSTADTYGGSPDFVTGSGRTFQFWLYNAHRLELAITSPIETTGSIVNRPADNIAKALATPGGNFSINVGFEATRATASARTLFDWFSDLDNRVYVEMSSSNILTLNVLVGGVLVATIAETGTPAAARAATVSAIYAAGVWELKVNGSSLGTDSGTVPPLTTFQLGADYAVANHFNDYITLVQAGSAAAPPASMTMGSGPIAKTLNATTTPAATASKLPGKALFGLAAAAATAVRQMTKPAQAATTPTATLAKTQSLGKAFQALGAASATLVRAIAKRAQASTTPAATQTGGKAFVRGLQATSTPAAAASRSTGKSFSAATTPASSVVRQVGKRAQALGAAAATATRFWPMRHAATTTPAASSSGLKVFIRAMQAATTPAASNLRQTGKRLQGQTTPAATMTRVASLHLAAQALAGAAATLTRAITRTLSASTTPAATATSIKVFPRSYQASTTPQATTRRSLGRLVQALGAAAATTSRSSSRTLRANATGSATVVKASNRTLGALAAAVASATAARQARTYQVSALALAAAVAVASSLVRKDLRASTSPAASVNRAYDRSLQAAAGALATASSRTIIALVLRADAAVTASIDWLVIIAVGLSDRVLYVLREVRRWAVRAERRTLAVPPEDREVDL